MAAAADAPLHFVRTESLESMPPPRLMRGPVAWIRENLFSGPFNTALTLFSLYIIYLIGPPLLNFLLLDAVWTGENRDAAGPRRPDVQSVHAGPS